MEAGYGGRHLEDGDYVVYIRVGVTFCSVNVGIWDV